MYVSRQWKHMIRPLVVSHATGAGHTSDFVWTGTSDYAPLLTLLSTLRLWQRMGGIERAMRYNHSLALRAGRYLARRWGTELLVGNGDASDESDVEAEALTASMVCVRLPGPREPAHDDEHSALQNALYDAYDIEAPVQRLGSPPALWIRFSAAIYNSMTDYERVGEVLWNMRGGGAKADAPQQNGSSIAAANGVILAPMSNDTAASAGGAAAGAPAPAVNSFGEGSAASSDVSPTMLQPDHTQVCIPPGAESLAQAREYYIGLLQMREVFRPLELCNRAGMWLTCSGDPSFTRANIHVGVEIVPPGHYATSKAHVAYSVRGIDGWAALLRARGYPVTCSTHIRGMRRFDTRDPFGNKVEFIEYNADRAAFAAKQACIYPLDGKAAETKAADADAASTALERAAASSSAKEPEESIEYFWHSRRAYSDAPLLRVGTFQATATPGDIDANLRCMHAAMQRASGQRVQLLLFPETWLTGYDIDAETMHRLAIPLESDTIRRVQRWCKDMHIAVCFGYPELADAPAPRGSPSPSGGVASPTASPSSSAIDGTAPTDVMSSPSGDQTKEATSTSKREVYNSSVLLSDEGRVLLNYRKTHLSIHDEDMHITPGDGHGLRVVELHGCKVGMLICYDVEFPEPARVLGLQGAQLLLVPTALAKGEVVHNTVPLMVVPTRALDNHVSVTSAQLPSFGTRCMAQWPRFATSHLASRLRACLSFPVRVRCGSRIRTTSVRARRKSPWSSAA